MYLLILLFPLLVHAHYTLSICSMIKNEAKWLPEWIEYHRVIGVEHFYLYDNDSTDNTLEVLKPYIEQGVVEVTPWASTPDHWEEKCRMDFACYQIKAFNDCVEKVKRETKWLAILDIDEYLVPVHGKESLFELLSSSTVGSFEIHWQMFGTSNIWEIPRNKLLIESLIMRAVDDDNWHRRIKSIHRVEAIKKTKVHDAQLNHGWEKKELPVDLFRIHHYFSRDEKDYLKKRMGLDFKTKPDFDELRALGFERFLKVMNRLDKVCDTTILQYAPAVREALFSSD